MKICPKCQTPADSGTNYCGSCGYPITAVGWLSKTKWILGCSVLILVLVTGLLFGMSIGKKQADDEPSTPGRKPEITSPSGTIPEHPAPEETSPEESAITEPDFGETVPSESTPIEPPVTEPDSGETTPSEPTPTDPPTTVPIPAETRPSEPTPTDPPTTVPIPAETRPSEPTPTVPIPAETRPSEPTSTEPPVTEPGPVSRPCRELTIDCTAIELQELGDTAKIPYRIVPADTTDSIVFYSDNINIATVTPDGLVCAVGGGETTIYIICGDIAKTVSIRCLSPYSLRVVDTDGNPIAGVYVVLAFDSTYAIPTFTDQDGFAYFEEIGFDYSTVSANIPALPDGYRLANEISEISMTPGICGEFVLEPIPDESDAPSVPIALVLNREEFTLLSKGDSWMLYSGELDPAEILWSSSNTSVATVTDGLVVAVGPGSAQIRAEYEGQTAYCTVHCNFAEESHELLINGVPPAYRFEGKDNSADIVLYYGESDEISTVSLTITNAENVTWANSDEASCSYDPATGVVTALGKGRSLLTAVVDGIAFTVCIRVVLL